MANIEEIARLGIGLSLESDSFTKKMSTVTRQIKNSEKEFKTAQKGAKDFDNSFVGLSASMNKNKKQIELYNIKLEEQRKEYNKLEKELEQAKTKLDEIEKTNGRGSKEWQQQADVVKKYTNTLGNLHIDISKTEKSIDKLGNELKENEASFQALGGKVETLDEKLERIATDADLAESEFDKLGNELKHTGTFFEQLENDVNGLSSKIDSGKSKINAYETEIKKIGTELKQTGEAHDKVTNDIKGLENALEQAKSEFGQNSTEANKLEQELLELKDAERQLAQELDKNNNALKQNQTELNRSVKEVNELERELKQLPFDQVSKKLESGGNSLKNMGQSMQGVTIATGALGTASVLTGASFESAMSKLQATMGISDKTSSSFKTLQQRALEMGSSTSFSASEAAEGMTFLALSGMSVEEVYANIPLALRAAEAGGMDLASACDKITDSMSAMNRPLTDTGRYLDIVAQSQRKSNTSMEQMLDAYVIGGGIFSQLNMTMEESGAILGVLANRGIKGSESGNALISVFSNLITETGQAGKALDALGISLYDSNGKQRNMIEVLKEMAQKLGVTSDGTSKLTDKQKQQYAAMVGGKTQFDTLMALLSGVSAEYDTLYGDLTNSTGAMEEMAKTMKDNLQGRFEAMKSAIEGALIKAFKALQPLLEKVVDVITDMANKFSDLDEGQQQAIVSSIAMLGAVGPLLIGLGNLALSINSITKLMGSFAAKGGGTAKMLGLLQKGAALLGGPTGIGAIILAVTAAVIAFKKFDDAMKQDVIPSTDKVVDSMKNVSDATKEAIKPVIDMSQTFEAEFIKISAHGTTMTEELKTGVTNSISAMVDDTKSKLEEHKNNSVKTFNEMFANTTTLTNEEKQQIINSTNQAYEGKKASIESSQKKINEILQNALNDGRELNKQEENSIREHELNIRNIQIETTASTKEEVEAIKKALNISSKELSAQQASDVIKEAEKQRTESVKQANQEHKERLKYAEMLREQGGSENEKLAEKVIHEANRMKTEQVNKANQTADSVINSAKLQAGEYSKHIDSMTGEVLNGWDVMANGVENFVMKMYYNLIDFFSNIPTHLQIFFNEIKIGLLGAGVEIINWWQSLPFTKDDALEGTKQSWMQTIDETTKYVNEKQNELDLDKAFRELPGKVRNSLENNRKVLEEHYKMPLEELVGNTDTLLGLTAQEFYALPPEIQQALRNVDASLQESGELGLAQYLQKTKMTKEGVVFEFNALDQGVQTSMKAVNNALQETNNIDLSDFVIQCQSAVDGGKTAWEGLPPQVQQQITALDSLLINAHGTTLGQFITNSETAKGAYIGQMQQIPGATGQALDQNNQVVNEKTTQTKNIVDTNTKETSNKADLNTKDMANKVDTNTKDMNNKVDVNTKNLASATDRNTKQGSDAAVKNISNANKSVTSEAKNMEQNVSGSMGGVNKNMQQEATNIYKGVSTSMHMMSKKSRESATEMYKGTTTSTHMMAQKGREDASRMHNGVRDSANAMAQKAREAASRMHNGVTTSTRSMANQAISDWNRIRHAYSSPIHASIIKTTTSRTRSIQNEIPGPIQHMQLMRTIENAPNEIQTYDLNNRFFNAKSGVKESVINLKKDQPDPQGYKEIKSLLTDIVNHFKNSNDKNDKLVIQNILDSKILSEYTIDPLDRRLGQKKIIQNKFKGGVKIAK